MGGGHDEDVELDAMDEEELLELEQKQQHGRGGQAKRKGGRQLWMKQRKDKLQNNEDELLGKYTWDYCMIFAIGDDGDIVKTKDTDGEVTEHEEKDWYRKKASEAWHSMDDAGLELTAYRSAQGDEVYVLIGASEERLMAEADRIDLDLPLERDEALAEGVRLGVRLAVKTDANSKHPDGKTRFCNLEDWENLYCKYDQEAEQKIYIHYNDMNHEGSVFKTTDRLKLIVSIIEADREVGGANLAVSKLIGEKNNPCLAWFPLHDKDQCQVMEDNWKPYHMFSQPLDMIRDYFGEKIAFYFAFLGFYNRALLIPAILGIVFIFVQLAENFQVSAKNVWFLGFSVAVWGTLFLEFWKRSEAKLRVRWGQTAFNEKELPRPEFTGEFIHSPIDGSLEYYFPFYQKLFKQLTSNSAIFVMIMAVVAAVSGIFIAKNLVAEGGAGPEGVYGMALASAAQIQILNIIYGKLSVYLNERENHKTDSDFENFLIAKSFLFKFVNSYNTLFYIAFVKGIPLEDGTFLIGAGCVGTVNKYRTYPTPDAGVCPDGVGPFFQNDPLDTGGDYPDGCCSSMASDNDYPLGLNSDDVMCCDETNPFYDEFRDFDKSLRCRDIFHREPCLDELRIQLLIIFAAQIVSANIIEILKPVISGKLAAKKQGEGLEESGNVKSFAELEFELAPVDSTFDDYDELVIQYGYVILFIVAMPLTPVLALFNNFIETWLDSRKYTRFSKRPEPRGAYDIGTWMGILNAITMIAVITNVALCIFLAEQFNEAEKTIGNVWVFVIVEHGIFIMKFAVEYFVPDEPRWVVEHIARQKYIEGGIIDGNKDERDEGDFLDDAGKVKEVELIDFEGIPIGPSDDQTKLVMGAPDAHPTEV